MLAKLSTIDGRSKAPACLRICAGVGGTVQYYAILPGMVVQCLGRNINSSMASAKSCGAQVLPACLILRPSFYNGNQDVRDLDLDRCGSIDVCLPLPGSDIPEIGCLSDLWMCPATRPVKIYVRVLHYNNWTDIFYRVDFLPGQFFDVRLEVHAPVNGSQATGNSVPDSSFTFTIAKAGGQAQSAASYFGISEPAIEHWNFTWFEGTAFVPATMRAKNVLSLIQIFLPVMPKVPRL